MLLLPEANWSEELVFLAALVSASSRGTAHIAISTIVMITECLLLEHELVKPALLLIEPASVVLQPPLLLVHLFLLLLSPFMLGIRKLSLLVDPYESLVPLPRSSSL